MNFPETNNINDTWQLSGYFIQSNQFYYLLTDSKGQILFTNPNFQKKITGDKNFPGTSIKDFLLAAEKDSCKRTMQQCLAAPGTLCSIDLHLVSNYRNFSLIRWEISAPAVELTGTGTLQWIGIDVDSIKEQVTGLGTKVGVLPERYKAYELGTSGLWRLELKVPAPATETPEEIIDHLRKQSFLAECNDNMARMYGYEKAEELLGSTMEDLMDLQDPVRMENLKTFIRNGFNSVEIETKKFVVAKQVLPF